MPTTKDTTLRYLATLKMIPRSPGSIDVGLIEEKLTDQGYDVTRRTIQRDLIKLCTIFSLNNKKQDGTKALNWFWMEGSDGLNIPEMSPFTALTFNLVESFLSRVVPQFILGYLDHHFKRANSILSKLHSKHFIRWHEKVRIIPRGQPLIPATINKEVLENVHNALIQEKQFKAMYQSKEAKKAKEYIIHPLGLVFRPEIVYLVCTLRDYKDIRQIALHRLSLVEMRKESRNIAPKFNLDKYIEDRNFGYLISQKEIKLEVLFDHKAVLHLEETPLSQDQKTSKRKDGRVLLKATVSDTSELRWWLLGFGDLVEVLKPNKLRDEFTEKIKNLAKMYDT